MTGTASDNPPSGPDQAGRSWSSMAKSKTGLDLARTLGWPDEDLSSREVRRGGTQLAVTRGLVGGQSAALYATVRARDGFDPLDSAALYAYHANTDWGVIADERGLAVFNSRWLADGDWFRLPHIGWADIDTHRDLLQALTREGLIDGAIERIASRTKEPSGFLRPVDDELVERLDAWRDQAVRYARSDESVDDRLQTLYAQLFVLRTVEDRGLDPKVPHLESVLKGSEHVDWIAWARLLTLAQAHVGSDLFDDDVARDIPEHVLAGVVRDLYHPRGLPGAEARYDFSWIEADVLGLAYEKYLATVLQPAPPAPQMEMFLSPERGVERFSVRKTSGTYYTPKFIRNYLSARCVEAYFARTQAVTPPRVIDIACGSGSFLVAAVDQVLKHLKGLDPARRWARELVEGGFIVGIDVDPKAVTTARLNLWQRLVEEPDALPLPDLSHVIIAADGLKRETWGSLDKLYEIVLGNPPFLATSFVLRRDELENTFTSARGRYDYSYLFVEQAIKILTMGGHLGMVAPNRLYKNRNGTVIRDLLTSQTDLLTLIDFGSTRPFDASSYIGCIVARRRDPSVAAPDNVRVLEVRSLDPNFLAALLLKADQSTGEMNSPAIRAYFARHPHSGAPWALLSENEERARILIEDVSARLDSIADIPQGIRTGGNDLFIFEIESTGGSGLCKARNGLGESAILELELLEPVIYGSEVQRYQIAQASRHLFYPYRRNLPLPDGELQAHYPNIWSYLIRNRDLLAARASLKKSGGKFYELVWPRDEAWLRRPKLMIRDLAPRTAFAIDPRGTTFLVGGTAVVPEQFELLWPLMAYLNSSFVDSLIRKTTPQFRGDFQKFEPQHIQAVPVLDRLIEDPDLAGALAALATEVVSARRLEAEAVATLREAEIDSLIARTAEERGILFNY